MTQETPRLSVVIPCFNEAKRIAATLRSLEAYFAQQTYSVEIIVVDDGGTDDTVSVARDTLPSVRTVSYHPNRGKGHAVKQGMAEAKGGYRLVYDADGSTPIDELENFWLKVGEGYDVVIGSRALPGSRIEIRQPWYRENMGRIYNLILRALFLTTYPDTQCGFKLFSAKCADVIFPRQTLDGFGSDCELLYIAKLHGFSIAQVPVRWLNSPDTRVNAIFDSLDMIREVLSIRVKALLGRYK